VPENKAETLSAQAWKACCNQSEVISTHSVFGPKVIRLSTGEYIKVFNAKSGLTKRKLFPKYKKFYQNAERLKALGFHTITITHIYYLPHINAYAVRYSPISGDDFRHVFKKHPKALIDPLIDFLIKLHNHGVYFHGMHLGNVLYDQSGTFGIIDMADLTFHRPPLRMDLRVRQLRRLLRYHLDRSAFESIGMDEILALYVRKSELTSFQKMCFDLSLYFCRL
jgi:hypothetical protein